MWTLGQEKTQKEVEDSRSGFWKEIRGDNKEWNSKLNKDEEFVVRKSYEVMAYLRKHLSDKVTFLGPTPKPIARTHNLYHYQIIIKYRFEDNLEETLNRVLDMTQEPENKDLRLIIDHEPQNFT